MTGAVIFNQSQCCVRGRTRCLKKQWRPCRLSFLVPDLSPARCARRLVTRGFAARATSFSATSFITTKMRACSQAKRVVTFEKGSVNILVKHSLKDDTTDPSVAKTPLQKAQNKVAEGPKGEDRNLTAGTGISTKKIGWEMGFGQNFGWEMGFVSPPPPPFRTLIYVK